MLGRGRVANRRVAAAVFKDNLYNYVKELEWCWEETSFGKPELYAHDRLARDV